MTTYDSSVSYDSSAFYDGSTTPPTVTSSFTTLNVTPPITPASSIIANESLAYSALQLNWGTPSGEFSSQTLVRSSFGTPTSIYYTDGVVLFTDSASSFRTSYLDTGLKPGYFYYYSLIVFNTTLNEYQVAGSAQGLVITDYGFGDKFYDWMPDWYLEQDALLPTEPLKGFLNLLGYEMDWMRSEIESLFLFSNIDLVSGAILPYIGQNYGIDYEPELGMTRSRVLVKNAVALYKERGTINGLQAAAAAYSGYGCEAVTLSPNLEIQLDDYAFDRSVGHWAPQNASVITQVLASVPGMIPVHATYNPIPRFIPALTTGITNGGAVTSLTVTPLLVPVAQGDSLSVINTTGTASQTFTASSGAAIGAVTVPVTSVSASATFPVGSLVHDTTQYVSLGEGASAYFSGEVLGYLPANLENVAELTNTSGQVLWYSTCTAANATRLGIPVIDQATPNLYVFSAYFQAASGVTANMRVQIDWYALSGAFISSTVGSAVAVSYGTWTRASVVSAAPVGAAYFGRTVKSTANPSGAIYMDACQSEVNTQATPGPTSPTPPRDLQVNLLPVRQQLIPNPVGLNGSAQWSITGGSLTPSFSSSVAWPANTSSGFIITAEPSESSKSGGAVIGGIELAAASLSAAQFGGGVSLAQNNVVISAIVPVTPELAYTLSAYFAAAPAHVSTPPSAAAPRTIQLTVTYYTASGAPLSPSVFSVSLAQPLVAGQAYSSLPITPIPVSATVINPNEFIVINPTGTSSISTTQVSQVSTPPAVGATLLPVNPFVANYNYPAGTVIDFNQIKFSESSNLGTFTQGAMINVVTPPSAVQALIQFTIFNPGPYEQHYFGAPLFEAQPAVLPYFDATFDPPSDYLWEGTPYASASDYYPNLPAKLARLAEVLPDYVPIGATFSLITGSQALTNSGYAA